MALVFRPAGIRPARDRYFHSTGRHPYEFKLTEDSANEGRRMAELELVELDVDPDWRLDLNDIAWSFETEMISRGPGPYEGAYRCRDTHQWLECAHRELPVRALPPWAVVDRRYKWPFVYEQALSGRAQQEAASEGEPALNEEQRRIVNAALLPGAKMWITGGPGTGKSTAFRQIRRELICRYGANAILDNLWLTSKAAVSGWSDCSSFLLGKCQPDTRVVLINLESEPNVGPDSCDTLNDADESNEPDSGRTAVGVASAVDQTTSKPDESKEVNDLFRSHLTVVLLCHETHPAAPTSHQNVQRFVCTTDCLAW